MDIQGHRSIHDIGIEASDHLKPEDGRDEGFPLSYPSVRQQRAREGWYALCICPVQPYGTEKRTSYIVIKAAVCFDIACEWRVERLPFGSDPIDHDAFQALGIVRSRSGDPLLNLQE